MIDDSSALPVPLAPARVSLVAQLADIPEEDIWVAKQKSPRTRRAYQRDVQHFMRTLGIAGVDELRQADHKAVIAWERFMREVEHAAASTICRRLAALSSLYKHLVRHGHAAPGGDSHNLINKSVNRTPPDTSAIQTELLAFRESHCFQASEENMAST